MGRVTSCSTCSEARPTASVRITTCGGANSGKTSSLACGGIYTVSDRDTRQRNHDAAIPMENSTSGSSFGLRVFENLDLGFLLFREQNLCADRNDTIACGHSSGYEPHPRCAPFWVDLHARELIVGELAVDPNLSCRAHQGGFRNHHARRGLSGDSEIRGDGRPRTQQ